MQRLSVSVILSLIAVITSLPHKSLHDSTQVIPQHENKQHHTSNLPSYPEVRAVEDYLLPVTTYPMSYDVSLKPYLRNPVEKNFTFDGTVTIRIGVREITQEIVMHSWDLNIISISVIKVSDATLVPVQTPSFSADDRHFFTIPLQLSLEVGELYDIIMTYSGVLNDEMEGFSRSEYVDENGNQEFLAITHLEPIAARRMIPCYDQPDFKAHLLLHVAREPGYNVLANMPVLSEGDPVEGLPGWEWVHFEETPVMSTYLICLAVHKFSELTSIDDSRFKVWSRPEVTQNGEYASEIIPDIIGFMEQFTSLPYQLPKYDQIGMVQFFAGAMENWGLITFTEPLLLYNPETGTTWDKNLVSKVVTHEAAHQWFGNLVSPKWWSSIWLNEGFARYFEYFAFHAIAADWRQDHIFVIEQIYTSFKADVNSSHPVFAASVDNPASIHAVFDDITYNKGACLVRLMINLLTEAEFRVGINNYLTALSYDNAHQDDLFFHLAPLAPPMPVTFKELMDSWTIQQGYPVVTVTRNYAARTATVSQQRFGHPPGTEKYIVPITFATQDNPTFSGFQVRDWLLPSQSSLTVTNLPASDNWAIFNTQQIGFYRVNYDLTNWGLIASNMNIPGAASLIDPVNRAQLMDDAFTFAENDMLDYVTALTTTTYLSNEDLWLPWQAVTDHLEYIRDRMYSTQEGVTLFQDYISEKIDLLYNTVEGFGVNVNDPNSLLITRWLATRWACNMGHATCNSEGSALFQQWRASSDPNVDNPVAVDLRDPAYCAGQRVGGQQDYDFLMDRYVNYNTNSDVSNKNYVLSAMGCTLDSTLLQGYLDESLGSRIAGSDALKVLQAVYAHPLGVDLALDFLITNWQQLDPLYGNVGRGFTGLASKLNTQQQYTTISTFLSANSGALGSTNSDLITSALATLQSNIAWNSVNLQNVMDFFRNNRNIM